MVEGLLTPLDTSSAPQVALFSSSDLRRDARSVDASVGGENSGMLSRYSTDVTSLPIRNDLWEASAGISGRHRIYEKHVGCTSKGQGPRFHQDVRAIARDLAIDYTALVEPRLPEIEGSQRRGELPSDYFLKVAEDRFYNNGEGVVQRIANIGDPTLADAEAALVDTKSAVSLIGVAVACSAVHDLRLSLNDFIDIYKSDDGAGAAMMAYRTQLAYIATNRVMDFIRTRLQTARMQMAFSPLVDPKGFAPHMRRSVDKLIEAFDQRIDGMNSRREIQKDFVRDFANVR